MWDLQWSAAVGCAELFVIQTSRIFCTRAPGSCLTGSFDQTYPPGRRITEETFLCEDRLADSTTSACRWQQSMWLRAVPGCMSPRTVRRSQEVGEGVGGAVRAAAGGLCELSVWLLIIQNGCKVETVLSLCGLYHSPRQRIWPDSVPTQRGCKRACALTHVAVGKMWTWTLLTQWCTARYGSLEPEPSAQEQKKSHLFSLRNCPNKFSCDRNVISHPDVSAL